MHVSHAIFISWEHITHEIYKPTKYTNSRNIQICRNLSTTKNSMYVYRRELTVFIYPAQLVLARSYALLLTPMWQLFFVVVLKRNNITWRNSMECLAVRVETAKLKSAIIIFARNAQWCIAWSSALGPTRCPSTRAVHIASTTLAQR